MQADAAKLVLSGLCGGRMTGHSATAEPAAVSGGNEGVKRRNRGEFGRIGPEPPSGR